MAKLITVNVYPDGRTDMDITGCSDDSCTKIVEDFKALGRIVEEKNKPEFYNGKASIHNLTKR